MNETDLIRTLIERYTNYCPSIVKKSRSKFGHEPVTKLLINFDIEKVYIETESDVGNKRRWFGTHLLPSSCRQRRCVDADMLQFLIAHNVEVECLDSRAM